MRVLLVKGRSGDTETRRRGDTDGAAAPCECGGSRVACHASGMNGQRVPVNICAGCWRIGLADAEVEKGLAGVAAREVLEWRPAGDELAKAHYTKEELAAKQLRWITVHPNGHGTDGVPLLVHDDGTHYTVVGGAGGSMNQQVFQKPSGDRSEREAQKKAAREKREKERRERAAADPEHHEAEEKKQVIQEEIRRQQRDLHDKVAAKLGVALDEDAEKLIRREAEKRALVENGQATEAERRAFAEKAVQAARAERKKAVHQVLSQALESKALRALGDEDVSLAEVRATIGGKNLVRQFTNQELDEFVSHAAGIAELRSRARAIQKALSSGDRTTLDGLEATLRSSAPTEAEVAEWARKGYLEKAGVETQTALVKGSNEASLQAQRRHQANGAADGLNSYVAAATGKAILSPDVARVLGVENAARVAAAYLTANGQNAGAKAKELRERIGQTSDASALAALEKCAEADRLVEHARAAAEAGDGSVSKAQASLLKANMAALKYRTLNTARGQLRAAAALAHHIENPSAKPMGIAGGDTATAAHARARGLGLEQGDYSVRKAQGGGFEIAVAAEKLTKLTRERTLAEAERNVAMDELRADVDATWESYHPQGFSPDARLQQHQVLAARAIVEGKRVVLNYGAGSGKTPTAYAAVADLLTSGKIDRAVITMPSKPRAQQEDFVDEETGERKTGEKSKFLAPQVAEKVAVVKDSADLARKLHAVKEGRLAVLVMSPQLMRERADDLVAAGFGGEKSLTVFDEAHELAIGAGEGTGSGMAQAARKLAGAEYAVAMSGSLIENNASELHSVYDMIHPGALGGQKEFAEEWRRLAQGGQDFFASEGMRSMRDRLSGGMVSYHKPVTRKTADGTDEAVTLERKVVTVGTTAAQKAAIAKAMEQYKRDRLADDEPKRKAAALTFRSRVMRILNTGEENPKHEALREIVASEKARDPRARVGVYAGEIAPLRAAGKAMKGAKLVEITGANDDRATRAAVGAVNDRENDVDGVLLSNAANYGVNLQGMDHLVKMHALDVPSKEDQLDHRHFRTGQTRDVRATTILTDHPVEQMAQFRNRSVKLPELALLASLADDSHRAAALAPEYDTLRAVAGSRRAEGAVSKGLAGAFVQIRQRTTDVVRRSILVKGLFAPEAHPRAPAGAAGPYRGGEFVPKDEGLFELPPLPAPAPVAAFPSGMHEHLPMALIEPDLTQDRSREEFSEAKIRELAESIRRGLDQPITVRPLPDGRFRVVAGERRFTAAKLLGWTHIRAQVRDVSDREAADIQLRENTARKDLNPMEEARAYQKRVDQFGQTPEELARISGRSTSYVQSRLALNNLIHGFQVLVQADNLKPTIAAKIARLNATSQGALLAEIVKWPEEQFTGERLNAAIQARATAEAATAFDFGEVDEGIAALAAGTDAKGRVSEERVKAARAKGEKLIAALGDVLRAFSEDDLEKVLPLAVSTKLDGTIQTLKAQQEQIGRVIANLERAKATKEHTGSFAAYVKTSGIKATTAEVSERVGTRAAEIQGEITKLRRHLKSAEAALAATPNTRAATAKRQELRAKVKWLTGEIESRAREKEKVRGLLAKSVECQFLLSDADDARERAEGFAKALAAECV